MARSDGLALAQLGRILVPGFHHRGQCKAFVLGRGARVRQALAHLGRILVPGFHHRGQCGESQALAQLDVNIVSEVHYYTIGNGNAHV